MNLLDTAMGTVVSQTVYAQGAEGQTITGDIMELLRKLEEQLLSWRLPTSEVYSVNASAGSEEGVILSEEMQQILGDCLLVSEESEGALDITVGQIVQLWNIDAWSAGDTADYSLPTGAQIQATLTHTGIEKLTLNNNRLYLPEGMQLDLGAVGKGIALDDILSYLNQYNQEQGEITPAIISVGGSVLTYGEKPGGGEWKVGIVNPLNTSENIGYLALQGQWCVSTSGDYERYVEINNVRYHHIIDPKTGYPANSGVRSVTILTKNGLYSDALSTACFILGEEKGKQLAESFEAEALFIDTEGNISMTEGMKGIFHLSK